MNLRLCQFYYFKWVVIKVDIIIHTHDHNQRTKTIATRKDNYSWRRRVTKEEIICKVCSENWSCDHLKFNNGKMCHWTFVIIKKTDATN